MKKYIIIAAAAFAALASCSKVEPETPNQLEISFKAYNVKPSTKAAEAEKASAKGPIEGATYGYACPNFGVYAAFSTAATASSSDVTYIDNLEVKANQTDEIWEGTSKVYWPLSGSLTFMAYSPKSAGASASFAPTTKTLTIPDFSISSQEDLMYSKASAATGETTNDTDYNPGTNSKETKGVDIIFNHALAQVIVRAKLAEDYDSNTEFNITGVTISGQKPTGTLTVAGDAASWALSGDAAAQALSNTAFPFTVTYDATKYADVATASVTAPRGIGTLVFPQTLDTQTLNVTYSMKYNGVTTSTTKEITLKATDFTAFEMGKKYVLDLNISATEIKYSPRIIDWVDGKETAYEVSK